ncbi:MAG: hypothetical protein Q8Q12_00585 [bacterium]|nr:hypothetical protein [bacterium]
MLRKKIFVIYRKEDKDTEYLIAGKSLDDCGAESGDQVGIYEVGIYELRETKTLKVVKELK